MLAATGMDWRRLDLPRLNDLVGRGVYYGAGRSEAAQCGDDPVVVVGAGNSAGQAVLNLAGAGARVTMLVRGERLGKTMSAYLVRRIEHSPLVDVRLDTELTAVHSDGDRLNAIGFDGVDWHPAAALFICIGGVPHTDWCEREGVSLDPGGYILTGADLRDDRRAGRSTATRSRWRRVVPASSRPGTCGTARPSASARRSARARWLRRCSSSV